MYGLLVVQRDDPENAAFQFFHFTPEAETVVLLRFRLERTVANASTSFLLEVRPLPQHLVLKVIGKRVFVHCGYATTSDSGRQSQFIGERHA